MVSKRRPAPAPTWQRARSKENKEERRRDILSAALVLWPKTGFAGLTMTQVAERAGVAKGTIYLYFASKEELCLALIEEEMEDWFAGLGDALDRKILAGPLTPELVAHLVASTLADRGPLIGLLAILESVVEHNVDAARARAFKRRMASQLAVMSSRIERGLGLEPVRATRLLLHINALVVGLWHMANPAPVVREVLAAAPELALFRIDFASELERALATLIQGLVGGDARKRGG